MTAKAPNEKPAGVTRPEAPAAPPPLAVKSWLTRLKELMPNIARHYEQMSPKELDLAVKDPKIQSEIARMEVIKAGEAKYLNRWVMIKGDTFPQDFPMYVTKVRLPLNHESVVLDGQKGSLDAAEILFATPVTGVSIHRVSSKSPYTVDGLVKFLSSEERKGMNRAKANTARESKQKIRLMAEQILIRRVAGTPGCGVSRRDANDALWQAEQIVEMLNQAEDNQPQEVQETVSSPIISDKTRAIVEAMDERRGAGSGKVFDPDTADNGLPYGIERITRNEGPGVLGGLAS